MLRRNYFLFYQTASQTDVTLIQTKLYKGIGPSRRTEVLLTPRESCWNYELTTKTLLDCRCLTGPFWIHIGPTFLTLDSYAVWYLKNPCLNYPRGYLLSRGLVVDPSVTVLPLRYTSSREKRYSWFCVNFAFILTIRFLCKVQYAVSSSRIKCKTIVNKIMG